MNFVIINEDDLNKRRQCNSVHETQTTPDNEPTKQMAVYTERTNEEQV